MAKTIGNGQGRPNYAAMYRAEVREHAETRRRATLTDSERRELVALRARALGIEFAEKMRGILDRGIGGLIEKLDEARTEWTQHVAGTATATAELNAARVECEALRERVAFLESEVPGLRQDSLATEAEADRYRTKVGALERRIADTFRRLTRHLPDGWQGKTIDHLLAEEVPGKPRFARVAVIDLLDWCNEEAQRQGAPSSPDAPVPVDANGLPILCVECNQREHRGDGLCQECHDLIDAEDDAGDSGMLARAAMRHAAEGGPAVALVADLPAPGPLTIAAVAHERSGLDATDDCATPGACDTCALWMACRNPLKAVREEAVAPEPPPDGAVARVVAEEPCPACRDLPDSLRVACETCGGSGSLPVLEFPGEAPASEATLPPWPCMDGPEAPTPEATT